ncbi:MAG: hypothetical protein NPINA01_18230 [Nitrospinaceae bacterium]|nr:MAG: hypothetical protein NPINA01_18230 [Nitrospinaceae bacterium]
MGHPKLNILSPEEFALLQSNDPEGAYDKETREALYQIIQKLGDQGRKCSRPEKKILKQFAGANFGILIKQGTQSEGKILHPGAVMVEGLFEGEILINDTLTVEPSGEVIAKITAARVICRGRIDGEIQATNQVWICNGATLYGNIVTPSMHVEEGAFFEGQCSMPSQPGEVAIHEKPRKKTFLNAG